MYRIYILKIYDIKINARKLMFVKGSKNNVHNWHSSKFRKKIEIIRNVIFNLNQGETIEAIWQGDY